MEEIIHISRWIVEEFCKNNNILARIFVIVRKNIFAVCQQLLEKKAFSINVLIFVGKIE